MAIVGGPAAGAVSGLACGAKKCFIAADAVGDITTTVNKDGQAGSMSSLLLLDVYDSYIKLSFGLFLSLCLPPSSVSIFVLSSFSRAQLLGNGEQS